MSEQRRERERESGTGLREREAEREREMIVKVKAERRSRSSAHVKTRSWRVAGGAYAVGADCDGYLKKNKISAQGNTPVTAREEEEEESV